MSEMMLQKPWFASIQAQALKELDRLGFPDRHDEDWKYTPLENLLKHRFHPPMGSFENASMLPLDGYLIKIINGQWIQADNLPKGLTIMPLLDAVNECPELVKPYFAQLKAKHGFHALNTAKITTGLFIHLEKGLRLQKPLIIQHRQTMPQQVIHLRHLLVAEEESIASLVEVFEGEGCYFTNAVSEAFLAPASNLVYYKIISESQEAFHLSHMTVRQKKLSQFSAHSLSLEAALLRSDIEVMLEEERADCYMNGLYLPFHRQHHENHTKVFHLVPHCNSFQDYKGIIKDEAHAVFNGKVLVSKGADKTEAHQYNKNLLLSLKAEVVTQPQLEIFAHDVTCAHGATVGQLDESALFYLRARGLSLEEATQYLIRAFVAENIKRLPHPQLAEWMKLLMNKQLGVKNDE